MSYLILIVIAPFAIGGIFNAPAVNAQVEYCDIYVGNEKVFSVTNTPLMPALERGEQINERIRNFVADSTLDPKDLEIRTGIDRVPVISYGDNVLLAVATQDSIAADKSELALAHDWLAKLQQRITEARKEAGIKTDPATGEHPKAAQDDSKPKSTGLSEHAVLLLFVEIAILLFASLACGEIMVRFGQPAIIGQIVAGLLLGQTFFGLLFPDLSVQLFPRDGSQSKLIEVISWIGVSFLLMLTGMETDTAMLKRLGRPALYIALLGVVIPLAVGAALSVLLPDRLMVDPQNKLPFAVFVGTVFAASSVPVVAKVLMDMKMIRLELGQLIMAASLSHDLLTCLLLALIVVLAGSENDSGGNPIVTATVGTICFLLVTYFGRPLIFRALRWVNDNITSSNGLITSMIVFLLVSAAITQSLGVHIVLGAFVAGLILSQAPVINHKVVGPIETVTMAFFAPVFFASAALNVNLTSLLDPQLGIITLLLSLAALASKLVACRAAGKLTGLGLWESLSIGVGANAKGSLGLILAMLGYSLQIITLDMFAVVIFISLFSTAIAAPFMKMTVAKVKVTDEERERMRREERQSRTILSTIRRVLWPTTGRGRNSFIAHLLNSIGQKQVIETTVLYVQESTRPDENPFKKISNEIDKKRVGLLKRKVISEATIDVIVEEVNRGYDLLIMSTDMPSADANHVFGPLVDKVIQKTPSRVLVVYEPDSTQTRTIKRVLVPVSGSELSVWAAEFGISLAKSLDAKVTCLSIVDSDSEELYGEETRSGQKIEANLSLEIELTLKELAAALDVDFDSILAQTTSHPAQAAVFTAQQHEIDLIVLGAEPKFGKELFLGHTINFVLRNAPCAVAVLKM